VSGVNGLRTLVNDTASRTRWQKVWSFNMLQTSLKFAFIGSPLIWRELIDRGGRGFLIGGPQEFNEYVTEYYGVNAELCDNELAGKVAEENLFTLVQEQKEIELKQPAKPINICITNSSSPLAYHLCSMLCSHKGFYDDIQLILMDNEQSREQVEGVAIEIMDTCSDHIRSVKLTHDIKEAFKQAAIIFILDQFPADADITKLATHYHQYAQVLDKCNTGSDIKVLAYGRHSDIAVTIMSHYATSMQCQHFCTSHYFTEQQAKSILAGKLQINPSNITNIALWGNTVDLSQCRVSQYQGAIIGPPDFTLSLTNCLFDTKWLEEDFYKEFSTRSTNEGYKEGGPCVAEAASILRHMIDWTNGSDTEFHSVGVPSDGIISDIPKGLCVCTPTLFTDGVPRSAMTCISDQVKASLIPHVEQLTQLYEQAVEYINKM